MTAVSVPALAILLGFCQGSNFHANCASRVPSSGNACSTGGTLGVLSEPDGFHVCIQNCNRVYDKEAFQKQPGIKLPDAVSVRTDLRLLLSERIILFEAYIVLRLIRPGNVCVVSKLVDQIKI